MTNHPRPDEPLTCSEVVERLAKCLGVSNLDRKEAEKILAEWREQIRKGAKNE